MIRWLIPTFFGTLALGVLILLIRNGAFMSVEINQQFRPAMTFLSTNKMGPYHQVLSSIEKVEKWAKDHGVPCPKTFGRYLDDPSVVEQERLQAQVGCLVLQNKKDLPALPEDMNVLEIPAGNYVVGFFEGSPALGPYKVYGKAADFIQSQGRKQRGPVIELYEVIDTKNVKTEFLFPVE